MSSVRLDTAAGDATPADGQSLGQLVAAASRDLSQLVRKEVELAKTELAVDAKRAGIGAGLLGVGGALGLFAAIFLSIAVAFGLAGLGLPLGVGFLIVGLLYLIGAGLLALGGFLNIRKVRPPKRTIQTVKDDIAWAKHPTTVSTDLAQGVRTAS